MSNLTYSVVIPSWHGIDLLKKNLPAVMKLPLKEVIVVDDHSPDNDIDFVSQNFPSIKVFRNEKNFGFGTTVNRGVAHSTADIVILLNLDALPDADIIKHIDPHFINPDVFAVSLSESQYGPNRFTFTNGYLTHQPISPRPTVATPTLWVSGGSGAFRRSYWNELGGLDPIYDPYYWEDIDLCVRATRRGWHNLWEPKAKVEHQHETTIGTHVPPIRKIRIQERNHLIFTWKYLSTLQWPSHIFHLVLRLIKHPGYARILFTAFSRIIKH